MVNGAGLAPVGLLLVGLLVGWMAGRTVPWPDSKSEIVKEGDPAVCAPPAAVTAPPPSAPAATVSSSVPQRVELTDQLRGLKIVELRQVCEEAEDRFLKQKISGYAPALDELPKGDREQELAMLRRQFTAAIEQSPYWRMDFSIETGGDVLYGEIVVDLEGNSEVDFKCLAWSLYYELNGQVQRSSLFGASACEGSGVRKRNAIYYLDIATFNFVEIGQRVTDILIPFPPSNDAVEYLRADTESWQSLGSRPWTRISRADFLAWQRKVGKRREPSPKWPV